MFHVLRIRSTSCVAQLIADSTPGPFLMGADVEQLDGGGKSGSKERELPELPDIGYRIHRVSPLGVTLSALIAALTQHRCNVADKSPLHAPHWWLLTPVLVLRDSALTEIALIAPTRTRFIGCHPFSRRCHPWVSPFQPTRSPRRPPLDSFLL